MVMDDPDFFELQDSTSIDIYEPGTDIEREIDWDRLFYIIVLTGGAILIMVLFSVLLMVPLIAAGMIIVNPDSLLVTFAPWSMLILSFAQMGMIIPPIWYIRKNGLGYSSLGIKKLSIPLEILAGFWVGLAMVGTQLFVNLLISQFINIPGDGDIGLFQTSGPFEAVMLIVVNFAVIAFTEELLFRGFMQRRMEMYFRRRSEHYQIISLIITSVVFAAIHLDPFGMPARFVLGLFLGYLARISKYALLGPSIAHGLNNAFVVIIAFLVF